MVWRSNAWLVAAAAATVLLFAQGDALARGGHSHGKARGVASPQASTSMVRAAAQPASLQAQALSAPLAASAAAAPASTIPSSSLKAATALPAPPAAPPPTPASVIGAPAPQLQSLVPLSPTVATTTLTAGGTERSDTTSSTASSSTSPTEAAPSVAGGGGKSLDDCMGFWDRDSHMTKAEWRGACTRSLNRLANVKLEAAGLGSAQGKR